MLLSGLTQIYLGAQSCDYELIDPKNIDTGTYAREEAKLQESVLELCPANLWHNGSYSAGCPRPILVHQHHQRQLQELHEALTIALTDIVQRWWTDDNACYPDRMPLEKVEEDILKVRL